jgi:hypothetical protein
VTVRCIVILDLRICDYVQTPSGNVEGVVQPEEGLPLILVGAGKTLQLRNVTVHGAASLPACLHLGAGKPR